MHGFGSVTWAEHVNWRVDAEAHCQERRRRFFQAVLFLAEEVSFSEYEKDCSILLLTYTNLCELYENMF